MKEAETEKNEEERERKEDRERDTGYYIKGEIKTRLHCETTMLDTLPEDSGMGGA